jgi:hypothetical protein
MYGWREDFNMTFMDEIPAQIEAQKYLRKIAYKHPFTSIYLGGHSKGGNLAIYAASTASDILQMRIAKVYNFDGPGLTKKIASLDTGVKVTPKILSFIPQDSVIGRLMEHNEKFVVIKSSAKDLFQHDLYTWEVIGTEPVKSSASDRSVFVDKTISRWLAAATNDERKIFVDVLFEFIQKAGAKNPMDLALHWNSNVPRIMKSYMGMPKEHRKAATAILKKLVDSFFIIRREEELEQKNQKKLEAANAKAAKELAEKAIAAAKA